MTDEQIVSGCIKNDAIAQKQLYEKFSRKMMGVCLRYAEDRDEAEDILQNGFIKVFENIETFRGTGSLEGWIRRIMVNTALNNYRQKKSMQNTVDVDDVHYMLAEEHNMIDSFHANDLLKIIQKLPTGFRTVFNLYAVEGYTHKEIADMLGISENTSKSQYSRARMHLQKMILIEKAV